MAGERPELRRVREICLALPEVSERLSHGSPAWFVRQRKTVAMFLDDHHGDGRLALWCPAAPGMHEAMVAEEPERFFRPPYVGPSGWLGVHLDVDPDWDELTGIVEDAYRQGGPQAPGGPARRPACLIGRISGNGEAPGRRPGASIICGWLGGEDSNPQ